MAHPGARGTYKARGWRAAEALGGGPEGGRCVPRAAPPPDRPRTAPRGAARQDPRAAARATTTPRSTRRPGLGDNSSAGRYGDAHRNAHRHRHRHRGSSVHPALRFTGTGTATRTGTGTGAGTGARGRVGDRGRTRLRFRLRSRRRPGPPRPERNGGSRPHQAPGPMGRFACASSWGAMRTRTTPPAPPSHPSLAVTTAERCAVELLSALRGPVRGVGDLADQTRWAVVSAVLNLVEGLAARGGRRRQLLEVAHGSLQEAKACVRLLEAAGVLPMDQARRLLHELDRAGALAWGLLRKAR